MGNLGLSALVAAIPLFILLYMLGIRRSKGHYAAFFATLAAVLLAIIVWGMPVGTGDFGHPERHGLRHLPHRLDRGHRHLGVQHDGGVRANSRSSRIPWPASPMTAASRPCSSPLPSGPSSKAPPGFGTPVAITAAMLVGLGFNARYAAGVCLIANTAPVAFGAIGIPIVVAAGVTGLDMMHISKIVGRQLPFLSLIVPLWLSVTMSGWKRSMEVLPAIIVAGLCFAVSQFVVSNFVGPYLPDIISAIVTIIGLGIFLHVLETANRSFILPMKSPPGR